MEADKLKAQGKTSYQTNKTQMLTRRLALEGRGLVGIRVSLVESRETEFQKGDPKTPSEGKFYKKSENDVDTSETFPSKC